MKLLPILSAAAVAFGLYAVAVDRREIIAWLSGSTALPSNPDQTKDQPHKIASISPVATLVPANVSVRGRTVASRSVAVRTEVGGKVATDPQKRGAFVRGGQMLCQLTSPQLEGQLEEARAKLSIARYDLALAIQRKAASEAASTPDPLALATVEIAKSKLHLAEAELQTKTAEIESLTLTAPFDGFLEADSAELGSLLQPGDLCATVIQMDPIKVVGFVKEADVGKIDVGTLANITLLTGEPLAGRVTFLSRSANPDTQSFRVEVDLPNKDLTLRDGQTAEMSITADSQLSHRIPVSALIIEDGVEDRVGLITPDGHLHFTPVTVLSDDLAWADVLGLPEHAVVAVDALNPKREGEAVTATPIDTAQSGN